MVADLVPDVAPPQNAYQLYQLKTYNRAKLKESYQLRQNKKYSESLVLVLGLAHIDISYNEDHFFNYNFGIGECYRNLGNIPLAETYFSKAQQYIPEINPSLQKQFQSKLDGAFEALKSTKLVQVQYFPSQHSSASSFFQPATLQGGTPHQVEVPISPLKIYEQFAFPPISPLRLHDQFYDSTTGQPTHKLPTQRMI